MGPTPNMGPAPNMGRGFGRGVPPQPGAVMRTNGGDMGIGVGVGFGAGLPMAGLPGGVGGGRGAGWSGAAAFEDSPLQDPAIMNLSKVGDPAFAAQQQREAQLRALHEEQRARQEQMRRQQQQVDFVLCF